MESDFGVTSIVNAGLIGYSGAVMGNPNVRLLVGTNRVLRVFITNIEGGVFPFSSYLQVRPPTLAVPFYTSLSLPTNGQRWPYGFQLQPVPPLG